MRRHLFAEEFFSSVGTVRDVRIIIDSKTRRLKGIAFVEFWEEEAVPLAIGLNGQVNVLSSLCGRNYRTPFILQKVNGAPLKIQATFAERNRAWEAEPVTVRSVPSSGPMKLYVAQLHPSIDENMLRGIFEPFGNVSPSTRRFQSSFFSCPIPLQIQRIELIREFGVSKGCGFVQFASLEDGRRALEQLNGFELAGRAMQITLVNDTAQAAAQRSTIESEEQAGLNMARTDKMALMARLAEGLFLEISHSSRRIHVILSCARRHRYDATDAGDAANRFAATGDVNACAGCYAVLCALQSVRPTHVSCLFYRF